MKKGIVGLLLAVLVVVSFQAVGNHYRYEIYDWAVAFEAGQSNLAPKNLTVGNESVAYLEGPIVEKQEAIVMLHGFGASKENWLRFAGHLSDDYRVIALDLMGHGENARDMSKSYSIVDQVAFVHKVTKQLGLERFHMVGNSMGGGISSLYASKYPEQVLSAVLISPAGIHDIPSEMDKLLESGQNPLIANSQEEFETLLDFVMEDKPYIPGPVTRVEAEKAASRSELNALIFSHLRADLEKGLENSLKEIKAPVLIIWGDHDRAINVKNIDKYASLIPDAKKLVLEDIGHLAMIEVPKQTAMAMRQFIAPVK